MMSPITSRKARSTWTKADSLAAAKAYLALPNPRTSAARELIDDLCSIDPYTRRRAADLARTICSREPNEFRRFSDLLINLAVDCPIEEWQARANTALAAAYTACHSPLCGLLVDLLQRMVKDERIAVRANALEALAIVTIARSELHTEMIFLLEKECHSSIPAIRARARRMLPFVVKSAVLVEEAGVKK